MTQDRKKKRIEGKSIHSDDYFLDIVGGDQHKRMIKEIESNELVKRMKYQLIGWIASQRRRKKFCDYRLYVKIFQMYLRDTTQQDISTSLGWSQPKVNIALKRIHKILKGYNLKTMEELEKLR